MNNTVIYATRCYNKTVYNVKAAASRLDSHSLLCHIYLKLVIARHTSLSDAQYLEVN